jgi:deoxyribonuclease V
MHQVVYGGRVMGYELKTTAKPVYVSPGHKVSLETAVEVARKTSKTRIPEPIRKAHMLAEECRACFKQVV